MGDAIAEFFRFVGDLTAKKIAGFVLLLSVVLLIVWTVEKQSSWFALARLERGHRLLAEIAAVERAGPMEAETHEIHRQIKSQLRALLNTPSPPLTLTAYPAALGSSVKTRLAAFVAGALPSLVALFLVMAGTKRGGRASAFLGALALGALCGAANAILPPATNAWVGYVFRPLGIFMAVSVLLPALFAFVSVRRTAIRKTILNNLRQLSAAFDQFTLEHGVSEARFGQIVGPSGYITKLQSVAGEDYSSVPLRSGAKVWSVRTAKGEVVEFNRGG